MFQHFIILQDTLLISQTKGASSTRRRCESQNSEVALHSYHIQLFQGALARAPTAEGQQTSPTDRQTLQQTGGRARSHYSYKLFCHVSRFLHLAYLTPKKTCRRVQIPETKKMVLIRWLWVRRSCWRQSSLERISGTATRPPMAVRKC